jgi:hypothetical protein
MEAGEIMSHISTRQSGTMCYTLEGQRQLARVEAVVVSEGVCIASLISVYNRRTKEWDEIEGGADLMLQLQDFQWYKSGLVAESGDDDE